MRNCPTVAQDNTPDQSQGLGLHSFGWLLHSFSLGYVYTAYTSPTPRGVTLNRSCEVVSCCLSMLLMVQLSFTMQLCMPNHGGFVKKVWPSGEG